MNDSKGCYPAVWGGIECTINRVGNEFKDQLAYSGHYDRPGDLAAIASLGIGTIRYPILWEKHQRTKDGAIDWRWTDGQLAELRDNGITPIAGLVHHGSGPSFTNLLDPEFPHLLARYAYEVANRYPWINDYTPVNEPLTTARFSGMYGLWFPHTCDEMSFYRMLLNQLKGVILAMKAIRSVNAAARLIQTEDLGKTYSTPLLAYQADFENIRRLLTFDILSGRVQAGHPQYHHMIACGIPAEELAFFEHQFCVPDVIGLNYYITSERWLDENVENFDPQTHGGNGMHCYADTEMVRANPAERGGFKVLAADIWHRYAIPLAVTELHLHCTREEQLRWFKEIWDDAKSLTEEGITIEGVTAWALLGSFDWDTLLTKTGSQYESGVFDIKTIPGRLRPTALASLIKMLVRKEQFFHPILPHKGWWHGLSDRTVDTAQPVLIIVDCGHQSADQMFESAALCTQLKAACSQRGILYKIIQGSGNAEIEQLQPWAIFQLFCPNSQFDPSLTIQSYVKFDRAHADRICVNICVHHRRLTIHQINKVLDLLIDGEEGAWFFGSNDLIFKSDMDVPDWIFTKQVVKEFELIQ